MSITGLSIRGRRHPWVVGSPRWIPPPSQSRPTWTRANLLAHASQDSITSSGTDVRPIRLDMSPNLGLTVVGKRWGVVGTFGARLSYVFMILCIVNCCQQRIRTGYSSVGRASDCRHFAVIRWSLARFRLAGFLRLRRPGFDRPRPTSPVHVCGLSCPYLPRRL